MIKILMKIPNILQYVGDQMAIFQMVLVVCFNINNINDNYANYKNGACLNPRFHINQSF